MTPFGWSLLLLVVGVVFLVLEYFIPSGGALGVICALSFLGSIIVGFFAGPWTGVSVLITVFVVVPTALAIAVRWWPETPVGRLVLVEPPQSPEEVLPETVAYRGLKDLIGRRGQSRGLMLPSGSVVIDGKTYDAVSEGLPIEPHEPVIVVNVSTQRLIVRPDHTIEAQLADASNMPAPPAANEPLIDDIPDPFAE